MKAIFTRYRGPTDSRGSRIIVTDGDHRIYFPYPQDCDSDTAHDEAAIAFCQRFRWSGRLARGGVNIKGKDAGNVYVFVDGPAFTGFILIPELQKCGFISKPEAKR